LVAVCGGFGGKWDFVSLVCGLLCGECSPNWEDQKMRPRSEIVLPDLERDLDYALRNFPSGVPSIVHLLVQDHGKTVAEEFIRRVLASVAASAIAALGQRRACQLLVEQLLAAEEWEASDL